MIDKYTATGLGKLVASIVAKSREVAAETTKIPGGSNEQSEVESAIPALRTADRHLTYAVEVMGRRQAGSEDADSRDLRLSGNEHTAMHCFIGAVEDLLALDAEAVGHIADYVGEHGTDGDGGALTDGVVVECLRIIVDAKAR